MYSLPVWILQSPQWTSSFGLEAREIILDNIQQESSDKDEIEAYFQLVAILAVRPS